MNGDVCADFPLEELREFHKQRGPNATVTVTNLTLYFDILMCTSSGDNHEHGSDEAAIIELWLHGN